MLYKTSNAITGSLPPELGGTLAFSPDGNTAYLGGVPRSEPEISTL